MLELLTTWRKPATMVPWINHLQLLPKSGLARLTERPIAALYAQAKDAQ